MWNEIRLGWREQLRRWAVNRFRGVAYLGVVTMVTASVLSCSTASASRNTEEQVSTVLEIVIQGSKYHVQSGALKLGEPAMILLKNADPITHGFEWTSAEWDEVEIETEGVTTFTRGAFTRLHLRPGQSVRIRFTPIRSGVIKFRCDLHPGMEGELFVLKVGTV